jgi:8-oxo-dGTP pyrophosphatase MutT (NUDIX family)
MARHLIPTHAVACCYRVTGDGLEILTIRSRSGRWTLPKGHLEPGELPVHAAAREAREEAGVGGTIDPEPLLWARITNGRRGISPLRKPARAPVFALQVRRQRPPLEPWRSPTWKSMNDGAAVRALRRPWPFTWRSRSIRALVRRVTP